MKGSEAIHPNKISVEKGITHFYIGQVTVMRHDKASIYFNCGPAQVLLRFLSPSLFRVVLNPYGEVDEKTTDAVYKRDWPEVELDVSEDDEYYHLTTSQLKVKVQKRPLRLAVYTPEGKVIHQDDPVRGMGWTEQKQVFCHKTMHGDEKFYGFGEKAGYLNKRGTRQIMWNSDVYAPHNEETNALYQSIPFFTSLSEKGVYGLFLDNPGKTIFDLTGEESYSFTAEAGKLDYYFFYGQDLKDVVSQYTELTGRMPLPPKWAIGYHQSRYSYQTEDEVREVARTFREKQIPCDVIYLDIHYMDGYRVFTWHPARFPNAPQLIQDLSQQGFHVIPIVDPGVKKDPSYRVYQEGVKQDYFCRYLEGDIYTGEVWPGESAFPDFTEEKVRKWWGKLHAHYTEAGIKGIWNDMNEPAVFNETKTMDVDVIHKNDGDPKPHKELHNLYGYYMSKATYEGLKELLAGERPFVVTRAGYAGIQRYAAVWTGDNRSFWEHLAMCIPMFLNMGISGLPFVGADIGGFAHPANGPLLARWTQLGTFTPFCRNHSALDVPRQEPWVFGEEIEAICRRYIELRYQLLPHLYTLFYQAAETGLPILRPLVMEFPDDPLTHDLADQFMVGEDILVAPVYRPDMHARAVYLPRGQWINYWTKEEVSGGQYVLVPTPLEIMPIFVKKGAIIPHGVVEQYVGEKQGAPLTMHVFGLHGEQRYTLYEDDGYSFEYEKGCYNLVEWCVTEDSGKVTVTYQPHHYQYDSGRKECHLVLHGVDGVQEVRGNTVKEWQYEREQKRLTVTVEAGSHPDTYVIDLK
ncbi:alpha-glucosidase [Caldalkalibacillus thermarum]|uniref:glycoside hydrolase family 31 protein n=1 Tax=Caldalkalibacillus thermarum TaxID=296745 RepID=UPI001662BF75|nr:glycoside hydrolase family 31 protein [Caldalkalibacillus thermarum]GGK11775.1 alpha-glucosidase [Caldalkalibacillus thermarum]